MDKVIVLADHVIGHRLTAFLLDRQLNNKDGSFEVKHVLGNLSESSWWPSLEKLAVSSGISYTHYSQSALKEILAEQQCDWLLLLSWKYILPVQILERVGGKVVNLHYSLLPKHRGVYPVNWAIQSGDTETGISLHFVDKSIDAGKIIEQRKIEIDMCDDAKSLLLKLDDLAFQTFITIWDRRNEWEVNATSQTGQSTYHSRQDFENTNQLNLVEKTNPSELLQLLRAKTFGDKSAAYFLEPGSGKKIYISINSYYER